MWRRERSNVALWLKADMQPPEFIVCFTPESGHSRGRHRLPLLTQSRHSESTSGIVCTSGRAWPRIVPWRWRTWSPMPCWMPRMTGSVGGDGGTLGLFYVRFMDDILVLSPTRWKLRRARTSFSSGVVMTSCSTSLAIGR